MKSTILDIYHRESPAFDTIKLTDEYKKLCEKECKLVEEFLKGVSKEQAETFDKIYELVMAQAGECEQEHFKAGFKMGVLLGLELRGD